MKKTAEEVREYVTNNYYCDADENGVRPIWEPFANYSKEEIDTYIECDTLALCDFFGIEYDEDDFRSVI